MTRSRRALVATGALTLTATATLNFGATVSAGQEPGSGLGFFALSASAPAVQMLLHESSFCYATPAGQNGCELVLPEATSQLQNGPLGRGVAAIVWPGALAADIGSLIITASNGQVPDSARQLNDPVRAQAETGTTHETATYDSVPGTSMKSTAHGDKVTADASVESSQANPASSFGKTTGSSAVTLTGASTAAAVAHSTVQNVSLAAGVVKIDGVVSDASATTDGTTAKAKGATKVSGMTVGGVPVTVDGDGVHAMGGASPLPLQTLQTQVNAALSQAGLTILMGPPTVHVEGASTVYKAASLIVDWTPPAPPAPAPNQHFSSTFTLGGANVSVNSAKAFGYTPPPFNPGGAVGPANPGTFVPGSPGVSLPGSPGLNGGTTTPNLTPGTSPVTPVTGGSEAPILASRKISLPDGLSPVFAIFGVLGSLFFMLGLRRLPDRVLEATASLCPLEENR